MELSIGSGRVILPDWSEARGLSTSELRTRANTALPILAGSNDIESAANGLLGRIETDGGSIIFCQLDPAALNADERNYLHYTRWRFTRAISQLIANLGGSFESDLALFTPVSDEVTSINIANNWNYVITETIPDPNVERHPDPGLSAAAKDITKSLKPLDGDVKQVTRMALIPELADISGEAIFQYRFGLPASMQGQDLELSLGMVDDSDATFVNGRFVGGQEGWNVKRVYSAPAKILKEIDNVITVRVWDNFGGGGMHGNASDFEVRVPQADRTDTSAYHTDYVEDFKLGDDPYRYYRW